MAGTRNLAHSLQNGPAVGQLSFSMINAYPIATMKNWTRCFGKLHINNRNGRKIMSKRISALVLMSAATFCFPVSTAQAQSLTVTKLEVNRQLKAGVPYTARLHFTGTANVRFGKACFLWSGEGPYCFDASVNKKSSFVSARLRTRNPNNYKLEGYFEYTKDGKKFQTNRASSNISVR